MVEQFQFWSQWTQTFIGFYGRSKFIFLCVYFPAADLLNVISWEVYLSYECFKTQGLFVMTLIEELYIYDYCKGFRLKVEIVEYDPNPIYLVYYR
jgi:hypothetical protein